MEENGKAGNGLSWDIWPDGNWEANSPHPIPHPHRHPHPPHSCGEAYQNVTCLKLGKRQYQEEGRLGVKKDSVLMVDGGSSSLPAPAVVARCQVEGCNVPLVDAKEYYKKHKVCGAHSKSPRVVVLGLEQRFCQQCSRFHAVSEFDDTRRSCRRRLAGHNERRRKISGESIMRSCSHDNTMTGTRYSCLPSPMSTSSGRVFSLLSGEDFPWVSQDSSSTSYQSSAALCELIAENRAFHFARQLYMEQQSSRSVLPFIIPNIDNNIHLNRHQNSSWHNHLCDAAATTNPHITLDLMQIACPSIEILSKKNESGEDNENEDDDENEEEEEECREIWKSLEETHV